MSEARCVILALVLAATIFIIAGTALCQDYIVMGTPLVNIRTGPGTEYVIVGRADKGDIFRVVGKSEGWYEIAMFSGDTRFVVAADYVYPLSQESLVPGHGMVLAEFGKDLYPIYLDIRAATERAEQEAAELIPASVDDARHSNFRKVMEDRIILEVLHIHGLQPALYGELMEAVQSPGRWPHHSDGAAQAVRETEKVWGDTR
jgi:hypothetical protein